MTRIGRSYSHMDDTWRIVHRGVPAYLGDSVDGKDCYVFQRKGGPRPTDVYSTHVIPVEQFWGRPT